MSLASGARMGAPRRPLLALTPARVPAGASCARRGAAPAAGARHVRTRAAEQQQQQQEEPSSSSSSVAYDRILLAILDKNPYLGDGSRQAISTTADLARIHNSRVTVLVVDHTGDPGDAGPKLQAINKSLQDASVLEKRIGSDESGSALVGDVADEIEADLVLISSEAVHNKQVDANLLCEFVPCAVLLLP